jgi:hypothetical protein
VAREGLPGGTVAEGKDFHPVPFPEVLGESTVMALIYESSLITGHGGKRFA